jgi:hypothetical protein
MGRFDEYYHHEFRADLHAVLRAERPSKCQEVSGPRLQPHMLTSRNRAVRRWDDERRALFAAGLFLTVLADQVCHYHFRSCYERFRELTVYPKWKGECPSGCYYHVHPRSVFANVELANRDPFALLPSDATSVMEREVRDFVERYLPSVDPRHFWECCVAEFPRGLLAAA